MCYLIRIGMIALQVVAIVCSGLMAPWSRSIAEGFFVFLMLYLGINAAFLLFAAMSSIAVAIWEWAATTKGD